LKKLDWKVFAKVSETKRSEVILNELFQRAKQQKKLNPLSTGRFVIEQLSERGDSEISSLRELGITREIDLKKFFQGVRELKESIMTGSDKTGEVESPSRPQVYMEDADLCNHESEPEEPSRPQVFMEINENDVDEGRLEDPFGVLEDGTYKDLSNGRLCRSEMKYLANIYVQLSERRQDYNPKNLYSRYNIERRNFNTWVKRVRNIAMKEEKQKGELKPPFDFDEGRWRALSGDEKHLLKTEDKLYIGDMLNQHGTCRVPKVGGMTL